MKKKLFLASLIYIYIYSVTPQNAYAIKDATSFNPVNVQVQASNNAVPVGTVSIWTRNEIPEGWLECNGQVVNSKKYPELAKLMKNVPNYQGYFLRGVGGNSDKLGVEQQNAMLDLTEGEINGPIMLDEGFGNSNGATGVFSTIPNKTAWAINYEFGFSNAKGIKFDIKKAGIPVANEIRPINKAVKYIIKAE